jgi:hypothetical protein
VQASSKTLQKIKQGLRNCEEEKHAYIELKLPNLYYQDEPINTMGLVGILAIFFFAKTQKALRFDALIEKISCIYKSEERTNTHAIQLNPRNLV